MGGYNYPFGLVPSFPYKLYSITLSLTPSQAGALFSAHQDILPAQPGFACIPAWMYFHKEIGAYTIADQSFWISADSTPVINLYSPSTLGSLKLDQTREINILGRVSNIFSVGNDIKDIGEKKLFVELQTSDASANGGAIVFTLWYMKVPVTKAGWDSILSGS